MIPCPQKIFSPKEKKNLRTKWNRFLWALHNGKIDEKLGVRKSTVAKLMVIEVANMLGDLPLLLNINIVYDARRRIRDRRFWLRTTKNKNKNKKQSFHVLFVLYTREKKQIESILSTHHKMIDNYCVYPKVGHDINAYYIFGTQPLLWSQYTRTFNWITIQVHVFLGRISIYFSNIKYLRTIYSNVYQRTNHDVRTYLRRRVWIKKIERTYENKTGFEVVGPIKKPS